MLKDRPFKHVQSERQYSRLIAYSSGQLGLFQETPAYISREGSTLQNASHFLIQNNEKIGEKIQKVLLCLHERFELQLSIASIFEEISILIRIPALKCHVSPKE